MAKESGNLHFIRDGAFAQFPRAGSLQNVTSFAIYEALHNLLKYSGATYVQVRLAFASEHADSELASASGSQTLEIEITDNGCGFDPNQRTDGYHHGLEKMTKRLAELGGTFDIQSEPGKGTRICMKIRLG